MTAESEHIRTALIAEDDDMVLRQVVLAAQAGGLKVVATASDGKSAIELVRQHAPDVAILDIEMPRMDGFAAAPIIRDELHVPVVMLTAHESPDLVRRAAECGVGAYLTKPPDGEALARAVEIAIARHNDMVELQRLNKDLQDALSEVRTLRGLLPVCSFCKRIRDAHGEWHSMHAYIAKHSEAQVSDSLCPECLTEHYPDYAENVLKRAEERARKGR